MNHMMIGKKGLDGSKLFKIKKKKENLSCLVLFGLVFLEESIYSFFTNFDVVSNILLVRLKFYLTLQCLLHRLYNR